MEEAGPALIAVVRQPAHGAKASSPVGRSSPACENFTSASRGNYPPSPFCPDTHPRGLRHFLRAQRPYHGVKCLKFLMVWRTDIFRHTICRRGQPGGQKWSWAFKCPESGEIQASPISGTRIACMIGCKAVIDGAFPRQRGMTTTGSSSQGDAIMKWTKPAYQDKRFGFELTMYILNR